ncbi:MAG: hypothetical protein GTO63_00800 [Anaerolineae bacterium]|nr:hypothetical protein [Anaerolineae bacterium]
MSEGEDSADEQPAARDSQTPDELPSRLDLEGGKKKTQAKPETNKKEAAKAEAKPEAKKKAAARPKAKKKAAAKPKAKKKAATKAELKPEAEPALEQLVVEPDEEVSHLLEELMATIDEEVEEAFGPGAMTDLATAEPTDQGEGEEQYIIFSLAESEYAVPAANVREIGEPPNVTPVPNVPDWVLGVANLRGDILSLVDLRLFLGMERIDYGEDTRMMVVHTQHDASSVTTGLMVDLVSDIRYLSVDRIGAPGAPIEDQVAPYLRGVYEHDGRLLVVLNLDQVLLSPQMRQFEPV